MDQQHFFRLKKEQDSLIDALQPEASKQISSFIQNLRNSQINAKTPDLIKKSTIQTRILKNIPEIIRYPSVDNELPAE